MSIVVVSPLAFGLWYQTCEGDNSRTTGVSGQHLEQSAVTPVGLESDQAPNLTLGDDPPGERVFLAYPVQLRLSGTL